jgi:hypothetical protein
LLANLFQVRLRARDAPEGHVAEGTIRVEPEVTHPDDEFEVVVEVTFTEGGPPGDIIVSCSPPEDFTAEDPQVELGDEGARITIPAKVEEEVELGRYYGQVVYSDEVKEHFEAEAALEVQRHWVRIDTIQVVPPRASPGDAVDLKAHLTFEGVGRVRGHARGRLFPKCWQGEEAEEIKLPRERSSVAEERELSWHVKLVREMPEGHYVAEVEFYSSDETARRRVSDVLLVVPRRGLEADEPEVTPPLTAPGETVTIRTRVENVGLEELDVRTGGELIPEAGGTSTPLEERAFHLSAGEERELEWSLPAPDRTGVYLVGCRARAERTEGSDPEATRLDVRPPNLAQVIGVVPSRPWAAPREEVQLSMQVVDGGAHPGTEATLRVVLEGDGGDRAESTWTGRIGAEVVEARVTLALPAPTTGPDGEERPLSTRYAAVLIGKDGAELLRVPGTVAVRRRVRLEPKVVKVKPDPMRIGDCLLPGERVVRTVDAGELTLVELSSGARAYAKGDLLVGIDPEAPMDDEFWDDALDAGLRIYSDIHGGLEAARNATQAEALLIKDLATGAREGAWESRGLVADTLTLTSSVDPDRKGGAVEPKAGILTALGTWLTNPEDLKLNHRRIVPELRRGFPAVEPTKPWDGQDELVAGVAGVCAAHLERLAELLDRVWKEDHLDVATLGGIIALVAAVGASQFELHRLRGTSDPWTTPEDTHQAQEATLQAMSAQLGGLIEVMARHRARRRGCEANTIYRAQRAAVTRDLEVSAQVIHAHSGQAASLELELRNPSHIDLELRLNVALPSLSWAVLEPPSKGTGGVAYIGPVSVPAGETRRLTMVVYVPTTVGLDSYVMPIEVAPFPRDIAPERGGEAR